MILNPEDFKIFKIDINVDNDIFEIILEGYNDFTIIPLNTTEIVITNFMSFKGKPLYIKNFNHNQNVVSITYKYSKVLIEYFLEDLREIRVGRTGIIPNFDNDVFNKAIQKYSNNITTTNKSLNKTQKLWNGIKYTLIYNEKEDTALETFVENKEVIDLKEYNIEKYQRGIIAVSGTIKEIKNLPENYLLTNRGRYMEVFIKDNKNNDIHIISNIRTHGNSGILEFKRKEVV